MRLTCLSPGVYATLVAFLVYFFCECLVMSTIPACQYPLGMSEKKQTSYKILMGLIVLMFTLQTIHNVCNWYITWLGFIYYGDAPEKALDVLEVDGAVLVFQSILDLLTTLRLAIADSIMVSTHLPLLANITNSIWFEGLEMLDHMQQELDGSDHPSDLQSWVYRYVMSVALHEK
jgi:hypothetical protein